MLMLLMRDQDVPALLALHTISVNTITPRYSEVHTRRRHGVEQTALL